MPDTTHYLDSLKEELARCQAENSQLKAQIEKQSSQLQNATKVIHGIEQMAAFSESAADIAHEINNPINYIHSSVQMLKRDIDDCVYLMKKYKAMDKLQGQARQEAMQEIIAYEQEIDLDETIKELQGDANTILTGIQRIREVAKNISLMAKGQEAIRITINVNDCINDTLSMVKDSLKGTITLRTELKELPEIESYAGKLNQVFTNLIKNAIEAINEKPQLEQECLSITSSYKKDSVEVIIADTGMGMSEETVERLFEKFYTTKSPGKGTGLGMGVCQSIIHMHKGDIAVRSQRGKGTTITITLPLQHRS